MVNLLRQLNGIQPLGDGACGEIGVDTQLRLRALAADEFFPQDVRSPAHAPRATRRPPAGGADVPYDTAPFPISNDRNQSAKSALFFSYFTSVFKISSNYASTERRKHDFIHQFFPLTPYYVLIADHARQYFEAVATGVGYPAVADKDFGTFVFPVPPLPEQKWIATYLDEVCAQVDAVASVQKANDNAARTKGILNRQMETLIAYRKAMIYECVTGQRRIKETDLNNVDTHG